MLAPTASYVYAEKLPEGAPINSQQDTITQIYEGAECIPVPLSGEHFFL